MTKLRLLLLTSVCLLSGRAVAQQYTDWSTFDPSGALGTLGSSSVTLAGPVANAFTTATFTGFGNTSHYVPELNFSEGVVLDIAPGGAYTLTFSTPITDPVLYISGLNAFLLFTTGIPEHVSGSPDFVVGGPTVTGFGIGEGIVKFSGPLTSIQFQGFPNDPLPFNQPVIQIGGTLPTVNCTLTCPPNVTAFTAPGTCAATGVNLGNPTLSGGCTVATAVNNAPAAFLKGNTVVTWTVTDTTGNQTTCQQTVTVVDNVPPTVTCPADVTVSAGLGCTATINLVAPTVQDNCGGFQLFPATRSDAQPLSNPYPLGTTVVTWTALDNAGNQGSCQQTVTVVDTEPPQFTCPPNVTTTTLPPAATTATDNCSSATVSHTDSSASTGCGVVVTRTYTVTDAAGNVTTCQQLITLGSGLFAADAVRWHQPLARNGASEDTDPSAGGSIKYRFKSGSTIPIKIHVQGCAGDVTGNANVVARVEVFGDTNCDGVADGNELLIDYNGVGGAGGMMDLIDGHLRFNLDTKSLPTTTRCYILRVTVSDVSSSETTAESVLLQAK